MVYEKRFWSAQSGVLWENFIPAAHYTQAAPVCKGAVWECFGQGSVSRSVAVPAPAFPAQRGQPSGRQPFFTGWRITVLRFSGGVFRGSER